MSSYTEENKRKAREILMGGKATPKVSVPLSAMFPKILTAGSKMYSETFFDYFDEHSMTDFPLPDVGEIPAWAQGYIPEKSDYMGENDVVYNAAIAYALKSVTHLVGYPGTGKSEGLPVFMAYRLGLPLMRLGLNKKGMGLDDLIGRQSIQNDSGCPVTTFKDGVLVKWIQMPSIVLADEFARANVEITNGLMSLMESNGKLIIEDRDEPIIMRHADCWLVASDNVKGTGDSGVGMVGTDQLDGAVLDRFTETIEMDYLSVEKATALLCAKLPTYPEILARRISTFGNRIQNAYKQGRLPVSFSQRSAYAIARKSCVTHNVNQAVKSVFLNRFDADDKTFVAQVYKDVTGEDL
jgi:MoxR-like ATPase